MASDPQIKKVYRFDHKIQLLLLDTNQMSLEDCQNLIYDVWTKLPEEYDEAPEVMCGPSMFNIAWGNATYVHLPEWSRKKSIVLHEVGHSIIDNMYRLKGKTVELHGPEYMTIYMWLLNVFCKIDYEILYRYCDLLDIKYVKPELKVAA